MKNIESTLQVNCVRWFRLQYPELARLLFSVPNGGYRSAITAKRMKEEGVVAGVSDLLLLVPNKDYSFLCIEMKTESGRQSNNQKIWQQEIMAKTLGKYIIVRSFDDFISSIKEYLYSKKCTK